MSTDLETALHNAAKSGRLNHLSVSVTWDGKWEAAYRGMKTDDHRIVGHSDPVSAVIGALTGRKIPEVEKRYAGKRLVAATQEALEIVSNNEFEDLL